MKECIFCNIVKKKMPSSIIYEDDDFIAVLDVFPNTEGQTLVLTKKHFSSYVFDLPDNIYSKLLLTVKKVSKILEKGLKVKRVAMVFEGQGVDHIHAKLYPMHKVDVNKFGEITGKEVFFNEYPGYITTFVGPFLGEVERENLLKKIKNNLKK